MKSIENRLERLETRFISQDGDDPNKDVQSMTDEELDTELVNLIYADIQRGEQIYNIGPEIKAMSKEVFTNMFISMSYEEEKRDYFDPLDEFARGEGIEI